MIKTRSTLYKYMDLQYIENSVYNGIFASHLDNVNDPYESEGIINLNMYRICCMTNSNFQMLMWSYYTNHLGCVVAFDVRDINSAYPGLIRKVNYEDTLRDAHRYMNPLEIKNSLYKKSKEWKHENEYRAVYFAPDNCTAFYEYNNEIYLKARATAVTFGVKVDIDSKPFIDAINTIHDYNINNPLNKIKVLKCILKSNKYQLIQDPQFNYESYL